MTSILFGGVRSNRACVDNPRPQFLLFGLTFCTSGQAVVVAVCTMLKNMCAGSSSRPRDSRADTFSRAFQMHQQGLAWGLPQLVFRFRIICTEIQKIPFPLYKPSFFLMQPLFITRLAAKCMLKPQHDPRDSEENLTRTVKALLGQRRK